MWNHVFFFKDTNGDFPGGPVVEIFPSSAGNVGLILGRGYKIPHGSQPQNQHIKHDRNNMVMNPIKTLKMVHIK